MYGATIGKLGILTMPSATNQACAALIPLDIGNELISYVFYFLLSKREYLKKLGQGGAQPNISQTLLKDIQIPLPPLNEQKRIVDKIERLFSNLDEGEALLKQVQQQLAVYRQSVLKTAVTGELIEGGATQWQTRTISELISDIRYGTAKKCLVDQSKIPVLRIPNIADGKIDLSKLKHADFSDNELSKLRLEEGDLLLVRSNGSVGLVGLSAVVTRKAVGFVYAGYLIRIKARKELLFPEYLNVFFHSPSIRSQIELHARSTSGVHNINSNEVRSLVINLPPLDEQKKIVEMVVQHFSQIDALETWCATELARSASLRQSILKDAFSGKLVEQDPNDEPVSELLKRIQAAKAAVKKAPARKRQ